jgi:hypothetical protein
MAKRIMYPLESCIQFYRNNKVETVWFELLTQDPAYMHGVLLSSQVYFFLSSNKVKMAAARKAMVHYSTTVQLLRERLADEAQRVSDSTIFIVLFLTAHDRLMTNFNSAQRHLEGLRQMISIRGGINTFRYNVKLMMELLKYVLLRAVLANASLPS